MASLSPLLFVFDDDEIILLRGDIARSDPSTSIQDHSQTDSNDNTVSISDTDSNDNDNTLANSNDNALSSSNDYYLSNFTASNPTAMPPCRPTTPPAPPPKLPPSMGNANFNSNRSAAEYSRSVLFPERYGLPPSCDTESLFESPAPATMSRDAQTVPRSVPRESLEFEALHSEFMGLIQLSGPLPEEASEEESYHHPFAAAPQSPESMAIQPERDTYHDDDDDDAWSEMPPPSDVPSDVEPDTPNVTEPLHSGSVRRQRSACRGTKIGAGTRNTSGRLAQCGCHTCGHKGSPARTKAHSRQNPDSDPRDQHALPRFPATRPRLRSTPMRIHQDTRPRRRKDTTCMHPTTMPTCPTRTLLMHTTMSVPPLPRRHSFVPQTRHQSPLCLSQV
jgi:hypothetical protein